MYTTSRLSTLECTNVETTVSTLDMFRGTPDISLGITAVVANENTHIVSETMITLTREQWQDVVCKINKALKETEYANKARV